MKFHKKHLMYALIYAVSTGIFLVLTGIIVNMLTISAYQYDHPVKVADNTPSVYGLWAAVNVQREQAGESDLTLDPYLTKSATAKCVDMIQGNYWDHVSPAGVSWLSFIRQYDPQATHVATGENLSLGGHTNDEVVNGWMGSTEHKANILDRRFTNVGYAICTDAQSRIMVVQHFAGE